MIKNHQLILKFKLLLGAVIICHGSLSGAGILSFCNTLLSDQHAVEPYDFRAALSSKGLDPEAISFEVKSNRGVAIYCYYRATLAGRVSLSPHPFKNQFQSNIHVEERFRGTGLGLLLYVIDAKVAYEKYGAVLRSSYAPSPDAIRIWDWIVYNGWGYQDKKYVGFYFSKTIVKNNFEDVYSYFLNRLKNADWYEMSLFRWLEYYSR